MNRPQVYIGIWHQDCYQFGYTHVGTFVFANEEEARGWIERSRHRIDPSKVVESTPTKFSYKVDPVPMSSTKGNTLEIKSVDSGSNVKDLR